MATYRLFGDLQGPTAAIPPSVTTGTILSLIFELTAPGWLDGYWWWVSPQEQSTAPQTFTVWNLNPNGNYPANGAVVPGTTVTSGELVAGQWNFIPLPQAVQLSLANLYQVQTATLGGAPVTANVWGTGDRWANGVSNGPLQAPPAGPNGMDQGAVATGSDDPTKILALYSDGYPFLWLDPQISTEAPPGSSFRLWPGMPVLAELPKAPGGDDNIDTTEQSSGTEFWLSDAYPEYTLNKIWFWSPTATPAVSLPAAALLPGSCAIWDVATQEMVPGTVQGVAGPNPSTVPDWRTPDGSKAAPGDGWVYCAYEGVTLPPGKYRTSVYCYGGGTQLSYDYWFFVETAAYFGYNLQTDAPAWAPNGIVAGPLTSPNVADASPSLSNGTAGVTLGAVVPGNSTYQSNDSTNTGTFLYPDTFDSADNGETRWVDVEVTPIPGSGPANRGTLLTNFP
jgi:hypothetical protein